MNGVYRKRKFFIYSTRNENYNFFEILFLFNLSVKMEKFYYIFYDEVLGSFFKIDFVF